MSKVSGRSRFGSSGKSGTVTVIEAPVRANFRRQARITFVVTSLVTFMLAATVASHYLHPILGLLLGLVIGVAAGAVPAGIVLCWPVLRVFIRWAPEMVLALVLVYGWTALNDTANLAVSLAVVVLLVGVPAAVPSLRRRVLALGMCLAVRHRLRLCFTQFIIANRAGSVPLILAARPTPAGERVWVWLRPGLALSDLEGRTDKLAVGCWANEVRIVNASQRYAALLRVDIARRNPLAANVDSPLPGMVPDVVPDFDGTANAPTSPGMPPAALDLPTVPEPNSEEQVRPIRPRRTPHPAANPAAEPVDNPRHFGNENADWV